MVHVDQPVVPAVIGYQWLCGSVETWAQFPFFAGFYAERLHVSSYPSLLVAAHAVSRLTGFPRLDAG